MARIEPAFHGSDEPAGHGESGGARKAAARAREAPTPRHPAPAPVQNSAARERRPTLVSSLRTYRAVVLYDEAGQAYTVRMAHFGRPDAGGAVADAGSHVHQAGAEPTIRSSLVSRIERWIRRSLERMSDVEVLKVIAAQSPAETIAEIFAASPEKVASENDWAELLLRGAQAKQQIAGLAGGLLTSSQAARVLDISVPGVKQRVERHKLLAVPQSGGQWGFPALQFAEGGHVRRGVPAVAKAGAHVDPWTLLSILVDDVEDARGGLLLERLDEPAVLADVLNRLATYGEHVAG